MSNLRPHSHVSRSMALTQVKKMLDSVYFYQQCIFHKIDQESNDVMLVSTWEIFVLELFHLQLGDLVSSLSFDLWLQQNILLKVEIQTNKPLYLRWVSFQGECCRFIATIVHLVQCFYYEYSEESGGLLYLWIDPNVVLLKFLEVR